MSERLEWELVPQVRDSEKERVHLLAQEALELDAMVEMAPHTMTAADRNRLVELQRSMEDCVVSPCETAQARLLSQRPGWEEEAGAAHAELAPRDVTFEQFLEYTGSQYDCLACPGASEHAGISGVPCDFDLTPMLRILPDDEISEQVQFELSASEMQVLADTLDQVVCMTVFREDPTVDAKAYLKDAARYLRFWADHGFGVAPAYVQDRE